MTFFIISTFLCFLSFVVRVVLIFRNRNELFENTETATITDLFLNKLVAKNSSSERFKRLANKLNLLLYLGVSFIVLSGVIFFISVYKFPV